MPATTPFVTACYIVKDEEDVLEASLLAIRPFVDDIVVYDTGSGDGTVEVARRCGARVVEGYWDADFGAARNRALAHCTGPWVISVDADEEAVGDPEALRRFLRATSSDLVCVVVSSHQQTSGHSTVKTPGSRIFRRSRYRWEGALHEQPIRIGGARKAVTTELLSLVHAGYTPVRWHERSKPQRNITVAEAALSRAEQSGATDLSKELMDAARSHASAADYETALRLFGRIDLTTAAPGVIAACAESAFRCAVTVGDHDVARTWLSALESLGLGASLCQYLRGLLFLALGDLDAAEESFRTLKDGTDVWGLPFVAASAAGDLATVLVRGGRYEEAFQVLLPAMRTGHAAPPFGTLLGLAGEVDGGLATLVAALPVTLEKEYAAQAQVVAPQEADAFLEEMHRQGRGGTAVLVSAAKIARQVHVRRALVWSLRLRERGFGQHCPLLAVLHDDTAVRDHRVLAGALLLEGGDPTVLLTLEPLLAEVEDSEALLSELRILTPGFASLLVDV